MHRILLKEAARPSRQPQRRLKPPMMDVVIYPILDSNWVSPVIKKIGITVVKNQNDELVPT